MNKNWLHPNRVVVILLAVAILVISSVAGLAQAYASETPSLVSFLGTFIVAIFVQLIFCAIFVSLASYHPKFAGVLYLLIFMGYFLQYPSNIPVGGVSAGLIADHPVIGVGYLLGLAIYFAAAGLTLVNALRAKTPNTNKAVPSP